MPVSQRRQSVTTFNKLASAGFFISENKNDRKNNV